MSAGLVVISGPSGCGKSSLIQEILKIEKDTYFSISTTTREIRDGEKEGVNYFFVSKEEFEEDIKKGNFLEWAKVHDNYYGTSLKPIKEALENNKLVLLDIDVQGHAILKEKFPLLLTSIFITTPSQKELSKRLKNRDTDSEDIIKIRLQNAKEEIQRAKEFEFFLINDDFEQTLSDLLKIIEVAKLKISLEKLEKFISNW